MAKRADNLSPRIANRRAFHDYHIDEKLEVGIVLTGSEVKSIRHGNVSLAEGFARIEPATMALLLHDVDIATYPQAGDRNHERKRPRKLLAHKRQIDKLATATAAKGATLIPLAMYFSDRGIVKVEIGVATGKHHHDKRADLKKKADQREIDRAMSRPRK
jgi:SsrA-binding protein